MKILVLAIDEVLRLLSTRRGLLSLAGFALLWTAVLYYGVMPAARLFTGATDSGLADMILPEMGLVGWQQWPTPELAVYWVISLYLLPFLAILTAADQTASDRSRGTLRFLVLRCARLEIFLGRYLGQMLILLLVVLITLGTVLLIVTVNSTQQLPAAILSSPIIVVNLMLVLAPYIALMALVSILARSARQATLFAMIIWLAVSLLVSYLKAVLPDLPLLDWALPGSQVNQLLPLHDWKTLAFAPIPIVHTLLLLGAGVFVMRQRDL